MVAGRKGARARKLRAGAWFLGSASLLVGGLVVGAHLFDEGVADPARALDEAAPSEPPASWDRVRVEVLNAGGVRGVAASARDHLRGRGFDVVFYGNASSFDREITVVLARTGSAEAARSVAGVLGVDSVAVAPDTTRFVDVTVLLGSDWSDETPRWASPSEEGSVGGPGREAAWWDLRRYLGAVEGRP
jgi:hypothetical protein